jgi:hypothetical protein
MFGQLLPNKNKNATELHSAAQYIREVPIPASKQGHCEECGCHGHGWAHAKLKLFVLVDQDTTLQCIAEQGRSSGCFFNRTEDKKCFSGSFPPCLVIEDLVVVEAQITFAQAVG